MSAATWQQAAFPGMERPVKARKLHDLWWGAWVEHWAPIVERVASSMDLGPEGITESDLEGQPDFMDQDEFRQWCVDHGVPFKE